ncbi:MAG: hypothetical protein QOD91_643, partial [Frankiales bacterium]|nr:hypothetical protein [Frankiales bacterium]
RLPFLGERLLRRGNGLQPLDQGDRGIELAVRDRPARLNPPMATLPA